HHQDDEMLLVEGEGGNQDASHGGDVEEALVASDALADLVGASIARAEHDGGGGNEQEYAQRPLALGAEKEQAVTRGGGGPRQSRQRRSGIRQFGHAVTPARSISPRSNRLAATS